MSSLEIKFISDHNAGLAYHKSHCEYGLSWLNVVTPPILRHCPQGSTCLGEATLIQGINVAALHQEKRILT